MTYSHTQISQYLACPRRYRHRYLDGWKERDTTVAMLFDRAFEVALGAFLRREDPGDMFFRQWSLCKDQSLHFSKNNCWDRMLEQGIMLLIRFCQDDRIQIGNPRGDLQIKFSRPIGRNEFVTYIDGIGELDGKRCLLEWKTSSTRYAEQPVGILRLDPQLVCYSWMTGIEEVAQVVFVRKGLVEIQYLRTMITEAQRQEFGYLVENTIRRIESADFLPHSGIRFPQSACNNCPYVGLCLGRQEMVEAGLVRRPGAEDFGWIDELNY
jgi:CRISPR/Cas system-associated exonuclease Cas4 (RecB family)